MPVTNVGSRWSSGDLIFYEKNVSLGVIGNILTIGDDAVTVGSATNDINFSWLGTTTGTFVLDAGAHTLAMTGLAMTTDGALTVSGLCHLYGMSLHYAGLTTAGTSTFGGPVIASSSLGVAGTLTTNQIACNSSLGVAGATTLNGAVVCVGSLAIGGPTTLHQVVNALQLPAADPSVAGQLYIDATVVKRSAG